MGERDPSWAGVTFDLPGTLHGELYPSCIPPKGRRGETRRDSNCALPSPATRGRAFKKCLKGVRASSLPHLGAPAGAQTGKHRSKGCD